MSHTREALRQGGAARDLAMAKMATGISVMVPIAALAAAGHITGDGPSDPELRKIWQAQGKQPYSIKLPGTDTWLQHNRLEPLGMLFGIAANIGEISGELPDHSLNQLALAAVLGAGQALMSKTWLQGPAMFFDAMGNPTVEGRKMVEKLVGSAVPGVLAAVERQVDPALRETQSLIGQIRQRVPGWSSSLPVRRNIFGEAIIPEGALGPDLISPIYRSTEKHDPVYEEILKHRVELQMPVRYIGGTKPATGVLEVKSAGDGVPLTPKEYERYMVLAGEPAKKFLDKFIETSQYKNGTDGPDGSKALMIQQIVQNHRDTALGKLIQEFPELREKMVERRRVRAKALTVGME